MTKKVKSLSYIEDTKKHHKLLDKVAKEASRKAVKKSHKKSVPVVYLDGEHIVKEDSRGKKTILKELKNNRRKVVVGEKTKIQK